MYLAQNGLKPSEISRILKINKKTAYTWARRNTVTDATRSGRPADVLTQETKQKITDMIKDKWCASIRKTAKALIHSTDFVTRGKTISPTTVCRFVRSTDWGHLSYRTQTAPMHTAKNIRDRISFATGVVASGYCCADEPASNMLDKILFTDESCIELFPCPNAQNVRIRTSEVGLGAPFRRPKHGLKVMVAGGLTANGLTKLHIVPHGTTINGSYYRESILPVFFQELVGTVGWEYPKSNFSMTQEKSYSCRMEHQLILLY